MSGDANRFSDWGTSAAESGTDDAVETTPVPAAAVRRRARRVTVRHLAVGAAVLGAVAVAAVRWSAVETTPRAPAVQAATLAALPAAAGAFSRQFTTAGPAGWTVSGSIPASGVTAYQLTSAGGPMPYGAMIPVPRVVALQITNIPPAAVAGYLGPGARGQTPLELLQHFLLPTGATNVVETEAVRATTVGGVAAARAAFAYSYSGQREIGTLLVMRRGATIVSVRVDAAPALAKTAIGALNVVLAHWTWYGSTGSKPAGRPPKPPATVEAGLAGQWIASGTVAQAYHTPARRVGSRLIRTWIVHRTCKGTGRCKTVLLFQLPNGSVTRAALVPEGGGAYRAELPISSTPCAGGASGEAHYVIDVTLRPGHGLSGTSLESYTGSCTPGAFYQVRWKAGRLPPPAVPMLTISPRRAATAGAFRAAARRVCSAINAQATPLAARFGALERAARHADSRAVRANSEFRIARLLGAVLPLSLKQYSEIPRPPAGAMDALWTRDIAETRRALEPVAAMIAAFQTAARSAGQYVRTGDPLAAQRLLTTPSLITDDATVAAAAGKASETIEHELQLPAICIDEPAIASIFSSNSSIAT